MNHATWFRAACLLMATAAALVIPRPAVANPIVPVTLEFEREGLDLDAGTVVPIEPGRPSVDRAAPQSDLLLACNPERVIRAVVLHNRTNGVEAAFLDGVPFNRVDAADLAQLSFTTEVVDEPFETGDSIVLRTDTGASYLLGNPVEDAAGVTFDTQKLSEMTRGLVRPAADASATARARARLPRTEALRSGPAALPPGLSAEDWRQIRGLIEEDGYRGGQQDGMVGGEQHLAILADDRDAAHTLPVDTALTEDAKLTASDGAAGDRLGFSVALDGDTALVGAVSSFGVWGPSTGAAYVFARSGTTWTEQAKLVPSGGDVVRSFGISVALSGDTALIGAYAGGQISPPGSAFVFVRNGTTWSEQAKFTGNPPTLNDGFGLSVALDGDTALVAAIPGNFPSFGSVYVFARDGTTWSEQTRLRASDRQQGDGFGVSVALDRDTTLIGAWHDDHAGGTAAGSAYVFTRNGTSWNEQAKLTASDAAPWQRLGGRVALSGDTALAVAGAFSSDEGSAYVFTRSGTTWSEQAKLTASDPVRFDFFGDSAALSGDTALVGAPGANKTYVFTRKGTAWSERVTLTASDATDDFGFSVAVSGCTALVGAARDDDAGAESGSAYVFTLNHSPVALCRDVAVSADGNCQGSVGPEDVDDGSFDADGDPITFGLDPAGPYPLGQTSVTLTATDDQDASAMCSATVTVVDATSPSLSVALTPDTLWPPNHRMVDVSAVVTASDNCGSSAVVLVSVASNEPDDAPGGGDGHTVDDVQDAELGAADFELRLRAERDGSGEGRTYAVVYAAEDPSGNEARAKGVVRVPHDKRRTDEAEVKSKGKT